jgi:D-glycero-D-manno-heptose 1,7-bisphosphate phosphatase
MSLPENRRKIVFLDRDGVINRDSPLYIKCWEEFEFLPRSIEAIRLLKKSGFDIIIITNQSAIGRGFITEKTLMDIHRRMLERVRQNGGDLLDIFFCPHRPDARCSCRKPRPGMIRKACAVHHIQPDQTVMVGDSAKDIECAHHAGCAAAVLVKTGDALSAKTQLAGTSYHIDYVAEDLYDAAQWIVDRERH